MASHLEIERIKPSSWEPPPQEREFYTVDDLQEEEPGEVDANKSSEFVYESAQFRREIDIANSEIHALNSKIAVHKATIQALQKASAAQQSTISDLEASCTTYRYKIDTLTSSKKDDQEHPKSYIVEELDKRIEFAENDLKEAYARNNALENEVAELRMQLDVFKVQEGKAVATIRAQGSSEKAVLEEKLAALAKDHKHLQELCDAAQSTVKELREDRVRKACTVVEHSTLKDHLARCEERVKELQSQRQTEYETYRAQEIDLESHRTQLERSTQQITILKEELAAKQTYLNTITDSLIAEQAKVQNWEGSEVAEKLRLTATLLEEEQKSQDSLRARFDKLSAELEASHQRETELSRQRKGLMAEKKSLEGELQRLSILRSDQRDGARDGDDSSGQLASHLEQALQANAHLEQQQLLLYRELAELHTSESVAKHRLQKYEAEILGPLEAQCTSLICERLVLEVMNDVVSTENSVLSCDNEVLKADSAGIESIAKLFADPVQQKYFGPLRGSLSKETRLRVTRLQQGYLQLQQEAEDLANENSDLREIKLRSRLLEEEVAQQAEELTRANRVNQDLSSRLSIAKEYITDLEIKMHPSNNPEGKEPAHPRTPRSNKPSMSNRVREQVPGKAALEPASRLQPISPIHALQSPRGLQEGFPLLEQEHHPTSRRSNAARVPDHDRHEASPSSPSSLQSKFNGGKTNTSHSPDRSYSPVIDDALSRSVSIRAEILNDPEDEISPGSVENQAREHEVTRPQLELQQAAEASSRSRELALAQSEIRRLENEVKRLEHSCQELNSLEYWVRKQTSSFSVLERDLERLVSDIDAAFDRAARAQSTAFVEQCLRDVQRRLTDIARKCGLLGKSFSRTMANSEYEEVLATLNQEVNKLRFVQNKIQEERAALSKG